MLQTLKLFVAFVFQTTFNRQTKWTDKSLAGNSRTVRLTYLLSTHFSRRKTVCPGRDPIHPFPIGLILQNCNNFGYYK
jgi:hypothetical protein